ncbi:hypothetical protein GCM10009665_79250 [Kitasatospora nipponensis]|uniref:Addiction module toxin RelE n=1 Tax=Kitasatospora nipponensis TaxID=258049 RepID=A0ABN1TBH4_9ACTN
MTSAKFAFAAHPDAIADLRALPDGIRDQALLHLQDLVHGERVATRLDGRLEGFHKVILGVGGTWASHRLVVQFRDAPTNSKHKREVFLVAAGPRADYAVYRTAQQRTNSAPRTAADLRTQSALARSPHGRDNTPLAPATTPPAATTPITRRVQL